LLESTDYGVGFQSKYCPKGAMEIKEDKKRQLQRTHGCPTVTHGRVVIPEGTHGWTHNRASNRACLTRRMAVRVGTAVRRRVLCVFNSLYEQFSRDLSSCSNF